MNECLTWIHFGYLLGIIAGWSMIIIGTSKWVISAAVRGMAGKFDEIKEKLTDQGEKQQDLEKRFLEMKADIPICYVRREDFIRHEVTILTKLDRLRDLIFEVKEQGKRNERES